MAILWKIQEIEHWIKSPHIEVSQWAVERLEEYFSEQAGPIMASLLQSKTDPLVFKAASYFEHCPNPQIADDLLKLFKRGERHLSGLSAQALAKIGDSRFIPLFLEKVAAKEAPFLGNTQILSAMMELKNPEGIGLIHDLLTMAAQKKKEKEGDEAEREAFLFLMAGVLLKSHMKEEMTFLWRYYLNAPSKETWGFPILTATLESAGVFYSRQELEEIAQNDDLIEDELCLLAPCGKEKFSNTLLALFKKKNYLGIIHSLNQDIEALFDEKKGLVGEPAMREWEKRAPSPLMKKWLLTTLAEESALIEKVEPSVQRKLAITALLLYSCAITSESFIGVDLPAISAEKQRTLLLEDREDIPEDETLIQLLSLNPDPEILPACLKEIKSDSFYATGRAVRLLGFLKTAEAIPALLSILSERNQDDFLLEAAEDALVRIGEPVLPAIESILRKGKEETTEDIICLLGRLPYPQSVEWLLAYADRYYPKHREAILYAMRQIGSSRFLPFLKAAMKENEQEEKVFVLISHLYKISDPELQQVQQRVKRRQEEMQEKMEQLESGDVRALIPPTVSLPLRCLSCRFVYTYDVREVFVSPESQFEEVYIRDRIVCKQCQTKDHYEVTSDARTILRMNLLTMMYLFESGKADLNEGPVKMAAMTVHGREMGWKEGLAFYQEQIEKDPNRPDLCVGYGNLLSFLNRKEEARAQFEKAVLQDPFAVEAIYSLAELEKMSNRPREAYSLCQTALARFDEGHFYRLYRMDKDSLREAIESLLLELGEEMGINPNWNESVTSPVIRKEKVGRNDPCPCGSGKKYKKCCLGKEEAKASVPRPQTMATDEENRLSGRLASFAFSPRFREERAKAHLLFFSSSYTKPDISEENTESLCFIDWFVHDFPLASGMTLISEFATSEGKSIPIRERSLLPGWIDSFISLYEVLDVNPERAEIKLKDLFTQKESLVRDVAGSQKLVRWDILGTRIIPVGEHLRIAPVITCYPPSERDSLIRFFTAEWERYKKETGEKWETFLKEKGYLLYHYGEAKRKEVPPPALSPEHHEMVFCKAIYDVTNFHGIAFRLKQEFDFRRDEEGEKLLRFIWLKRGKSKESVREGESVGRGLILQAGLMSTPLSQPTLVLGTVILTENRLTLEVISRERLEAGKSRLEELLGHFIQFRVDTFQSVEAALSAMKDRPEKKVGVTLSKEREDFMLRRLRAQHMERWIETPIPALDGKTPQEMVKLPGGAQRVEQLLKQIENMEEKMKREGRPFIDLSPLRQKLGLPGF